VLGVLEAAVVWYVWGAGLRGMFGACVGPAIEVRWTALACCSLPQYVPHLGQYREADGTEAPQLRHHLVPHFWQIRWPGAFCVWHLGHKFTCGNLLPFLPYSFVA
jgi:hypothetical protein